MTLLLGRPPPPPPSVACLLATAVQTGDCCPESEEKALVLSQETKLNWTESKRMEKSIIARQPRQCHLRATQLCPQWPFSSLLSSYRPGPRSIPSVHFHTVFLFATFIKHARDDVNKSAFGRLVWPIIPPFSLNTLKFVHGWRNEKERNIYRKTVTWLNRNITALLEHESLCVNSSLIACRLLNLQIGLVSFKLLLLLPVSALWKGVFVWK